MENNQTQNMANQINEAPVKKRKWAVFLLAAVGLTSAVGLILAGYVYWLVFMPIDRQAAADRVFIIEKGEGVKVIAARLEKENLTKSAFWFETYIWWKNYGSSLKAGQYFLSQNLNVPEITTILRGGKVIDNSALITFPEGFTAAQIKTRLAQSGVAAGAELADKIIDWQTQYKFFNGAPEQSNLEGFLFPDTYRFARDAKKEAIIKIFLDNFEKKLRPAWREEINRQGKTIYQTIILASVIQQEAANEEEMPMIAGVFANRLELGMPLQSDATVNYATGKKSRQASADDIKIASPYNTYINKGLPPGPICNPGEAAIEAAIYPQQTDFYYFFHPLNESAIFSKTLDEHNKNRAKYLDVSPPKLPSR